jgi:UDP-glucose 4-epimerase
MKKILVTGGAGFIGSNCCNALARDGYTVIAFDNLSLGTADNLEPGVQLVKGDVRDAAALQAIGPVDIVIHLAAASSAPMFTADFVGSIANNVLGHATVLEYARTNGVQKVLFASTSSIYGNNPTPLTEDQSVVPPNFYSVTKHAQEELSSVYSALHQLEIIGFRFMSVYGLHEEHKGKFANLVSQFIWGIEQGKSPVLYGDGNQTRDFVNVRDLIEAFRRAIETPKRFGYTVFNIGTERAVNLRELVAVINSVMGTAIEPTLIPNPISKGYVMAQEADASKIKSELNFVASVSLDDGVREIVGYRKKHKKEPASLSF